MMNNFYSEKKGRGLYGIKQGVVIYENVPYYFVEELSGSEGSIIVAYDIDSVSKELYKESKNPYDLRKKYTTDTVTIRKVKSATTPLSQYIDNSLGNKGTEKVKNVKYKEPVFVSVVREDADTATGTVSLGFDERGTKYGRDEQGVATTYNPTTGVFIGFPNVYWFDKTIYPLAEWSGYLSSIYTNFMGL